MGDISPWKKTNCLRSVCRSVLSVGGNCSGSTKLHQFYQPAKGSMPPVRGQPWGTAARAPWKGSVFNSFFLGCSWLLFSQVLLKNKNKQMKTKNNYKKQKNPCINNELRSIKLFIQCWVALKVYFPPSTKVNLKVEQKGRVNYRLNLSLNLFCFIYWND